MNILRIVYDFADTNNTTGGLSTGPYELSVTQAYMGHKVYVLCGNLNKRNLKKLKFKYSLCNGNLVVYNLPRALFESVGPFFSTSIFVLPYYFYLKLTKKIDVIHNHQQMGLWFLLYKKIFGFIDKTPLIHTNHGLIKTRLFKIQESQSKPNLISSLVLFPLWKLNDALSLKVADILTVVSKDMVKELKNTYNYKKEIYVVENGVDTNRFTSNGDKIKFKFEDRSKIIGYVGRLTERKNIHLLIKSLEFLSQEYKLVLIGKWDENYKKKIILDYLRNKERIQDFGEVSYFENDKYFRSFDIFAIPSQHEGLPKVALEALSLGVPVVGSGFTFSEKIPFFYFLKNTTPQSIANKIMEVSINNIDKINTTKIINSKYSWKVKSEEYLKLYKTLL